MALIKMNLLIGTYTRMAVRQRAVGGVWDGSLLPVTLLVVPFRGGALHGVCTQVNHSLQLSFQLLLGEGVRDGLINCGEDKMSNVRATIIYWFSYTVHKQIMISDVWN